MRTRVSVVLVILVVASSAVNCLAQSAGSSVIGVTATELREVETGWSAKKALKAAPEVKYAK